MNNKNTRFITEVAIFAAIGIILDIVCGALSNWWGNGGSISIAMLPIFIMAFRWGLKGGLITGLIIGVIQIIWAPGSYLVHPIQVLLDYPIAYGVIGLSALVSKKVQKGTTLTSFVFAFIGIVIPGLLRLASHTISGLYFGTDLLGSFVYNAGYMIPSIVLCIVLMLILLQKNRALIFREEE